MTRETKAAFAKLVRTVAKALGYLNAKAYQRVRWREIVLRDAKRLGLLDKKNERPAQKDEPSSHTHTLTKE